jgi:colanic acid/amylovoran biosynthesis glycosyltransferase
MSTNEAPRDASLLYVGLRLPELSETFVYREVLGLRTRGRSVAVASVRRPRRFPDAPALRALEAEALVVYERATLAALPGAILRNPRLALAAIGDAFAADHRTLRSRAKHTVQGLMGMGAAARLRHRGITHVHAHMAHVPATVGLYIARGLGAGFSFTGHAADLFVDRAALAFKLRRARFVSCISHWHHDFYREIAKVEPGRLPVIRCSVEIPSRIEAGAPEIVCVARLVPKKGIDMLIEAFAQAGLEGWRLRILGDGSERERLEALAQGLGSGERIVFDGAQSHEACLKAIRGAGVVALPCRTAANGDRDGIPVVLMEAMAAARPVIAGDLPSIRELVSPGCGLLVKPDDVPELAQALRTLATTPELRGELGGKARERVIEEFSDDVNLARLDEAFNKLAVA